MAGLGRSSALFSTVGIGVINLVATIIALFLIDRLGRKVLMIIGSVGVILFLGLVSNAFLSENFGGYDVPIYIFGFIGFFAVSQGAVIWVYIAEIFPNKVRARGQSLGSFTHWLLAAVIAQIFPGIAAQVGGGYTFLFFTFMMVFQLIFVLKFMKETKGRSLEEIQDELGID